MLSIGIGSIEFCTDNARFRKPIDGIRPAASTPDDLDVGFQTLQYPLKLLILGGKSSE